MIRQLPIILRTHRAPGALLSKGKTCLLPVVLTVGAKPPNSNFVKQRASFNLEFDTGHCYCKLIKIFRSFMQSSKVVRRLEGRSPRETLLKTLFLYKPNGALGQAADKTLQKSFVFVPNWQNVWIHKRSSQRRLKMSEIWQTNWFPSPGKKRWQSSVDASDKERTLGENFPAGANFAKQPAWLPEFKFPSEAVTVWTLQSKVY